MCQGREGCGLHGFGGGDLGVGVKGVKGWGAVEGVGSMGSAQGAGRMGVWVGGVREER